jgi:hypothetical protein
VSRDDAAGVLLVELKRASQGSESFFVTFHKREISQSSGKLMLLQQLSHGAGNNARSNRGVVATNTNVKHKSNNKQILHYSDRIANCAGVQQSHKNIVSLSKKKRKKIFSFFFVLTTTRGRAPMRYTAQ